MGAFVGGKDGEGDGASEGYVDGLSEGSPVGLDDGLGEVVGGRVKSWGIFNKTFGEPA